MCSVFTKAFRSSGALDGFPVYDVTMTYYETEEQFNRFQNKMGLMNRKAYVESIKPFL